MITTMMGVIIVIIILVLLIILVLKMTKKYHIIWYWCQDIWDSYMVEEDQKIRARPERSRFFSCSLSLHHWFWSWCWCSQVPQPTSVSWGTWLPVGFGFGLSTAAWGWMLGSSIPAKDGCDSWAWDAGSGCGLERQREGVPDLWFNLKVASNNC